MLYSIMPQQPTLKLFRWRLEKDEISSVMGNRGKGNNSVSLMVLCYQAGDDQVSKTRTKIRRQYFITKSLFLIYLRF